VGPRPGAAKRERRREKREERRCARPAAAPGMVLGSQRTPNGPAGGGGGGSVAALERAKAAAVAAEDYPEAKRLKASRPPLVEPHRLYGGALKISSVT
jgi:hypothetical protein